MRTEHTSSGMNAGAKKNASQSHYLVKKRRNWKLLSCEMGENNACKRRKEQPYMSGRWGLTQPKCRINKLRKPAKIILSNSYDNKTEQKHSTMVLLPSCTRMYIFVLYTHLQSPPRQRSIRMCVCAYICVHMRAYVYVYVHMYMCFCITAPLIVSMINKSLRLDLIDDRHANFMCEPLISSLTNLTY